MSFKALEALGEHGSRLIGSIVKITAFGLGIDQNQANKVCRARGWLGWLCRLSSTPLMLHVMSVLCRCRTR